MDLHVVDSQRSFLTDLRNAKYQKLLSLMSLATESLKRQKISDRIIPSDRGVQKNLSILLINIRKRKTKNNKRKWHYSLIF